MKGIELLEKYPQAAEVIIQYYADEFLRAVEASDAPEEFKQFSRLQRIDDQYIADLIDNNPRGAFDVFDAHKIYIDICSVFAERPVYFIFEIMHNEDGTRRVNDVEYATRKEAETAAVEEAFEILNDKLCQTK